MTRRPRAAGGFTLIEVLVALVIVAFGMGALMTSLSSAADTVSHLRERSLAQWIALNRVTDVRLQQRPNALPSKSKSEGDVDFAGGKWHWQQEIVDSGLPGLLRVDVHVRRAAVGGVTPKGWVGEATGFLGSAYSPPVSNTPDWDGNPNDPASPPPKDEGAKNPPVVPPAPPPNPNESAQ